MPDVATVPAQEDVQEVALVEDQVRTVLFPATIKVGRAEIAAVAGAGGGGVGGGGVALGVGLGVGDPAMDDVPFELCRGEPDLLP